MYVAELKSSKRSTRVYLTGMAVHLTPSPLLCPNADKVRFGTRFGDGMADDFAESLVSKAGAEKKLGTETEERILACYERYRGRTHQTYLRIRTTVGEGKCQERCGTSTA